MHGLNTAAKIENNNVNEMFLTTNHKPQTTNHKHYTFFTLPGFCVIKASQPFNLASAPGNTVFCWK